MEKIDLVIELLKANSAAIKSMQVDNYRQFKGVNRRLDRVDKRLDRIEDEVMSDKDKLQAVYETREKVKIEFGWQWSLVSLVLVIIGSGVSRLLPF